MSFIPNDTNTSQHRKPNIERQSTESSSNNESFRSTPKGTPDLSNFTPKNNPDGIKIKSFVATSESDDYLSYSDDSENNLQKRVKVSTPLQIMKKTQQEFPEKRHKHHHNQQNEKSSKGTKISQIPGNKENTNKNIQRRDIHINQNNEFEEDENPFAEYGDQSPKMLSSSAQTGDTNSGSRNFNNEHEVLMKPRNLGKRRPKLVNKATQVKYHIVNTNKPPELKVENVQTRDADQFEIDFDDEENEDKNKNPANNRNKIEDDEKIQSPQNHRENDNTQFLRQKKKENNQFDKSPRHHNDVDKDYDNRKSPKHHHEDDKEYGRRKSPRHHRDDDRKYEKRSPRHHDDDDGDREYDKRKSQRHHHDDEREYNNRRSPRYRDEYRSEDNDRRKSPRYRQDNRDYEKKSPRHHNEEDKEHDRRKSPRYHDDDDDREYDKRKSPRHHRDDERENDNRRSPRYRDDDRKYERRSPRHHDDDREYDKRKSPRHHHDDEREYDNRRSPRYRDESPRHRRDDDREHRRRRSPRNRNEYDIDEYDKHRSPRKRYDDRRKSPKSRSKDSRDEYKEQKNYLDRQDFSSSNSIDRLADSIQPNTLTRREISLPEQIPLESPTKATQTIENDIFERDFNLPENDDDESGEGLRVLYSIFNDVSSSSSFAAPNQNQAGLSSYQQRVNKSIEKAKMLKEMTFPKTPKLADISIQIDMSEDEKQEELLSSSFDRKLQEIDLQNNSDLVKERDIDIKFIQQRQELSEGSDIDNNDKRNSDSFNFILSENDDDNKLTKPSQKVPSKVRLLADSTDLAKISSKASFRSKSGDVTIAPNFTEDSISSIEQPPESEEKENLIPLSEELQAIEPSIDQTKTKETLSAALSSIDLYTDNEEEDANNKTENDKNYSYGDHVRERGFGQVSLNSHSDASNNRLNKQDEILNSSKSQNSQQLAATQKIMSNENSLSDIPKSPRTHESMLSNEKLLSQPSNTDESQHSAKSNQSQKSRQSNQSEQSHQSYQSTRSNQSNQSNHSQLARSNQSNQSHHTQSTRSIQSHQSQQSNHSSKKDSSKNQQNTADAPKSAFSLIYSEQETDEMNKSANKMSPFVKRNRPFSSSERIDPTSATLSHSSAKPNQNPKQIPSSPISTNSNHNSGIMNKSGLSSQSFSHSPPINDEVFEEEEEFESSNLLSEKSSNIFIKNKEVQLTPSEESSLIRDFPGDSVNKKQKEKAKKDFPIKNSPSNTKNKSAKENLHIPQEIKQNRLQDIESSSHSNIEFIKNRNIGMRQSEESSLINDFPGDSYTSEKSKKQQKKEKNENKNDQLDFPRVSSNSNSLNAKQTSPKSSSNSKQASTVKTKTEITKPTSPKSSTNSNPKSTPSSSSPKPTSSPKSKPKQKTKQLDNSIKSEIIQLQASDYSENSRPVFNFEGENSENISKKLRSLKMQNSSSLSSSKNRNAQRQQNSNERREKSQDSQSQSYESNSGGGSNKKIFKPIILDQLSSESDSFNKLQKKNDDLDDNSSVSDNFSNSKKKTKNGKVNKVNNYNRSNQMKNYLNDNDEKASSSNEEND